MSNARTLLRDAADGFDANKNEWTFAGNLLVTVGGTAAGVWLLSSLALSWLLHAPFWLFALPLAGAIGWGCVKFIQRQATDARAMKTPEHLRGSRVVTPEELQQQLDEVESSNIEVWAQNLVDTKKTPSLDEARRSVQAGRARRVSMTFGGVTLPPDLETQGVLFCGGTGSGKSVALRRWIKAMREGGHKIIVLDPKPELIEEFWEPDSVLLNPFDQRGVRWDFWSEIKDLPDIRAVAEGVFPPPAKPDPFTEGARNIFAGLLELASSNKQLIDLMSMETEDLQELFAHTMAAGAINASNSRGTGAFLQRMQAELQVLRYPEPPHWAGQPKFSLTDWILNDDDKRIVFLSYAEDQLPALRKLLTLWVDIAIRRLLTMTDARSVERSRQRRVGFMLEELPALKTAIPMLEPLITRGRSFGAVWALVLQDPSQLEQIFGPGVTRSLLSNTTTWLTFRTNDAETAKFMSEKMGEREEVRKAKSITMGVEEERDGKSIGDSQVVTQTVLASEISALPDNHAYLSIGGPYAKAKIVNMPMSLPKVAPGKVLRTDLAVKRQVTAAVAAEVQAAPAAAAVATVAAAAAAAFCAPDEDGVIVPLADLPAADGEVNLDDMPSTEGDDDLSMEDLIAKL